MKTLKYLFVGIFFGLVLTKEKLFPGIAYRKCSGSKGFHMFGIFMTAVRGSASLILIQKLNLRTREGEPSDAGETLSSWRDHRQLVFGFGRH